MEIKPLNTCENREELFILFRKLLNSIGKNLKVISSIDFLLQIYQEIEKPIQDEELKKLMNSKHIQYMKVAWSINISIGITVLSILFVISF